MYHFFFTKYLTSKCNVSLQEYQSKRLLLENGVNVQRFQIAETPDQAFQAGKQLSILKI